MKKYRPSNGSESDHFMAEFCFQCAKYEYAAGCPIIDRTMLYDVKDSGYPEEWVWTQEDVKRGLEVPGIGTAICTAFEVKT